MRSENFQFDIGRVNPSFPDQAIREGAAASIDTGVLGLLIKHKMPGRPGKVLIIVITPEQTIGGHQHRLPVFTRFVIDNLVISGDAVGRVYPEKLFSIVIIRVKGVAFDDDDLPWHPDHVGGAPGRNAFRRIGVIIAKQ